MKLALIYLFLAALTFLISGFVCGTWNVADMDMDVKIGTLIFTLFIAVMVTVIKAEK